MNMKQLLLAIAVTLFFADARSQNQNLDAHQFQRDFVSVRKMNGNDPFAKG